MLLPCSSTKCGLSWSSSETNPSGSSTSVTLRPRSIPPSALPSPSSSSSFCPVSSSTSVDPSLSSGQQFLDAPATSSCCDGVCRVRSHEFVGCCQGRDLKRSTFYHKVSPRVVDGRAHAVDERKQHMEVPRKRVEELSEEEDAKHFHEYELKNAVLPGG
ncbi:hypothetical protein Naga_100043g9 [Nannochloropsis gaditana]|uniref:Uncharacterized protein n=1 Tax=Nannochloropsis gaditana TaxID=72520 RepID=W7TRL3_9STRA|nr:hypothetical protein Naga_100043g9 [Nannochloropsis gaditana]